MNNKIEKLNNSEIISESGGINWQQFQEFWKNVTTRPETINKSFSKAYQYEFSDIETIHHKIIAVSKSYETKGISCNFTAYYTDKSKRVFNSFDTFDVGVRSTSSSTKSITLEYTIAIQHPQTKNYGSYKISIDLISKLSGDDFMAFPKFMRAFSSITGHVKVEHVDYTVAQNFINIVKDWFETMKASKEGDTLKFFQKYSDRIPSIFVGIFTIVFACTIYLGVDEKLQSGTLADFAKFAIISLTQVVIMREIIYRIGRLIENEIDSLGHLSSINLTTGDRNLISEIKKKNKDGFHKTIKFLVIEMLIGFLNSVIAFYLPK